jgi:hypothetical protein
MGNDIPQWSPWTDISGATFLSDGIDKLEFRFRLPAGVSISDPELSWLDGIARLLRWEDGDGKA